LRSTFSRHRRSTQLLGRTYHADSSVISVRAHSHAKKLKPPAKIKSWCVFTLHARAAASNYCHFSSTTHLRTLLDPCRLQHLTHMHRLPDMKEQTLISELQKYVFLLRPFLRDMRSSYLGCAWLVSLIFCSHMYLNPFCLFWTKEVIIDRPRLVWRNVE
jgi:hypothetical protein